MFSHLKRRIGVLTAVAVLAALVPTLAVSTASAAPLTTAAAGADPATYVACPTGSAAAAGFTDTTSTDVDCIAHFGITTGVTATTYEPSSSIPRWQMALYLTRMLTKGSFTLGSGADQGFTDISGESAAIQTAINQLMQAGVTTGVTATTFAPADNVSREQMAMFMNRALNLITAGVGGQSDTANSTKVNGAGTGYNYTDIDSGSVTFEGHNSIVEMYSLQIPGHAKTITTFGPSVDISRAEMATWITNALAHTNARPEGLWVQTSQDPATLISSPGFGDLNNDLHITNRDASHVPIAGTLVDTFGDKTYTDTDPFAASGACNTAFTIELGNTGTECAVDIGDLSTNALGNLAVTVNGTAGEAKNGTTWTYWAHTGAVGAAYDNDSPSNSASITSSTAATVTTCTDSVSAYAAVDDVLGGDLVPYGTTITVTCQLEVSTATGTDVAQALIPVVFTDEIRVGTDNGTGIGTSVTAAVSSIVTTTVYSDAAGTATYTLTSADPSALTTKLNRTEHTLGINVTTGSDPADMNYQFDDNSADTQSLTVALGVSYGAGLATGVSRTATGTLRDQYGNGVASTTVTFESTSTNAAVAPFTQDVTRVTDSSGVATLGYTSTKTASSLVAVFGYIDDGTSKDGAAIGGAVVGTREGAEIQGTASFYRTTAGAVDLREIDSPTTAVGTSFTATTAGVLSFVDGSGFTVDDEIQILVAPVTTAASPNTPLNIGVGAKFFVKTVATNDVTLALTRGGTQVTFTVDSGAVGDDTPGTVGTLGIADIAGDVIYEFVIDDSANDTLVISTDPQTGNTVYSTYAYDSNDQFQTKADVWQGNPTTATMAAFEAAVAGKFTKGVQDATELGDLYSLDYQATTTGIQLIQLGS